MELNIGSVLLPRFSLLSSERQALEQWCESQKKSWYRDRSKSISSRQDACAYLIEGLYQAWCCITPRTALEIPLHSGSYHSSRFDAINHLSHQFVHVAIDGLEALGWVYIKRGYKTADGKKVITRILPMGPLLLRFQELGLQWQQLVQSRPKILIRNKDPHTRKVMQKPPPDSSEVKRMQRSHASSRSA